MKFSLNFLLQFTEHGIEGVVPFEILPPEVRSKYQAKPAERVKRAKKEDSKGSVHQVEESQVYEILPNSSTSQVISPFWYEKKENTNIHFLPSVKYFPFFLEK